MREPYDRGGDELSINVEKKPLRMIIVKIWPLEIFGRIIMGWSKRT